MASALWSGRVFGVEDTAVRSATLRGVGIALMVALASLGLFPVWRESVHLWANDPLRSIGAAFPVVAMLGVLQAWRRLGWELNGTWWGLALMGLSFPLARLFDLATLMLVFHGHRVGLVHPGPVFLLYGLGAVLLFGGKKLLRACWAPLCLLLLVNPVPYSYNTLVDLPLQTISADTARGFAHLIGLHPTGEQLKMMFAPDFGMLIVPGCNGVRGSITFMYLALFFGYSRGLRWRALGLVTLGAFCMGYALNLLRLCVLVIYYRVGLSYPVIQDYGVGVDYAIGCTIFLVATLTLGVLIRSLEPKGVVRHEALPVERSPVLARVLCVAVMALVFVIPQAHSLATVAPLRTDEAAALRALPAVVGPYRLTRTYSERNSDGNIALAVGEYVHGDSRLTMGVWVASAHHLLALSRLMQGAHAISSGALEATAHGGLPVHFATSFYDDGVARELDADMECSAKGCGDYIVASEGSPLVMNAPKFQDLMLVSSGKRLPIYLQRETADTTAGDLSAARAKFEADARLFTSFLDISPLVDQLGSRP